MPPRVARDGLLLLALVLMAPIALPRMEQLRMDSDAGVYSNRAIHHLQTGGLRGSIPVRDRLEGELLAIFDRDNMQSPRHYLPGTYVAAPEPARFHFQFFPGWPMVMALWASVFGVGQASAALVFLYALLVLLFGFLLERLSEDAAARAVTLAIFASSPLLLYFSKYTTSETLLLFLLLFVLYFLGGASRWRAVLAAAGVLLFAVSHSSTFLYAPLLLLPLLEAYRSADRRMALFSLLAFGALLAGLPLGHFFSPFYLRDIFSASFALLPVNDPAAAGLAVVAAFYAAGFALSLAILARAVRPSPRLAAWAASAERLLSVVVPPTLVLVAVWTAWRGYQLGWTDRFTQQPPGGAWSYRLQYAGQGWPSVAHLDIVSMVLATSLVGLPTVLMLAVLRGREVSASPVRAFLLITVLWTLAVYTFFRVDTPFNYYASRYFLPVLVPATMLLLGSLLGHFQPPRAGWLSSRWSLSHSTSISTEASTAIRPRPRGCASWSRWRGGWAGTVCSSSALATQPTGCSRCCSRACTGSRSCAWRTCAACPRRRSPSATPPSSASPTRPSSARSLRPRAARSRCSRWWNAASSSGGSSTRPITLRASGTTTSTTSSLPATRAGRQPRRRDPS